MKACEGDAAPTSTQSAASSARMLGEKGRQYSRCLPWRLIRSFTTALRGSARMLRLPRALGPISAGPWNQPTSWSSASSWAVRSTMSSHLRYRRRAASSASTMAASL
jgi:hypothetical protein